MSDSADEHNVEDGERTGQTGGDAANGSDYLVWLDQQTGAAHQLIERVHAEALAAMRGRSTPPTTASSATATESSDRS